MSVSLFPPNQILTSAGLNTVVGGLASVKSRQDALDEQLEEIENPADQFFNLDVVPGDGSGQASRIFQAQFTSSFITSSADWVSLPDFGVTVTPPTTAYRYFVMLDVAHIGRVVGNSNFQVVGSSKIRIVRNAEPIYTGVSDLAFNPSALYQGVMFDNRAWKNLQKQVPMFVDAPNATGPQVYGIQMRADIPLLGSGNTALGATYRSTVLAFNTAKVWESHNAVTTLTVIEIAPGS